MKTLVTSRGQTVVPAAIRRRHEIKEGDRLVWLDDGSTIRVIPVSGDSIQGVRGVGKGEGLIKRLLEERAVDRQRGS